METDDSFKLPAERLDDVVAHATISDGVAVAVGRPFSRRDDYELWYCSYSVSQGSQILTTGTVAGVDSLQALLLCLGVVRAELDGISARGHVTVPEHLFGSQRGL